MADPTVLTRAGKGAFAVLVSAIGGVLAELIGLPAGWLTGGALAVTLAAFFGLPVGMPDRLRDVIFILIGVSMGASVASDSLALLGQWPITLFGLFVELILIVSITGWMLTRFFGLDRGTAYLSSFPGHLSFVLGIAAAGVGNSRQIVIIQVMRILMLTIAIPIAALFLPLGEGTTPPPAVTMDALTLVWVTGLSIVGGLIFLALRIPAGLVLGAMAVATALKLGGAYDAGMPGPLLTITLILTGALIGSRFVGITRAEFLAAFKGGVIATALTLTIATLVVLAVLPFIDMPFGQVWIGLAPGALEGMGALGLALGYDTAFIAAHHVIRLLMLSFAIPAVVLLIRWREKRATPD